MRLEKISVINIRRHFSRAALLTIGLTVAVATVVALYTITTVMQNDLQKKLDAYGANIVIVPKTKSLPLSYNGIDLGGLEYKSQIMSESDVDKLKHISHYAANLKVIAPALINLAEIKGKKAVAVGVDFTKEFEVKKWWQLGAGRRPKGRGEALLGSRAASMLGLKVGRMMTIEGSRFKVAGILQPVGSTEDDLVYVDLKQAQTMYGQPGQISMIEVAAWCYNCPIEQIVAHASDKLPNAKITAVWQAAAGRNKVVTQFTLFSIVLSAIMVLVAVLIVFTNMLSAVRERRREIGIFRAIGYRRLNILEIIIFETLLIGIISGLVGYVLGFFAARILAPGVGVVLPVELDINIAYFAVLGTMMLVPLASLYPALTAANLSPAEAINDI